MELNTINLPIHTLITLGFYIVAFVYLVFTVVFYYHWREYSINNEVTKTTLFLYFITTLPLITILGVMTLII